MDELEIRDKLDSYRINAKKLHTLRELQKSNEKHLEENKDVLNADQIEQIQDYSQMISELAWQTADARQEVIAMIETLSDYPEHAEEQNVLYLRYIVDKNTFQIADELFYGRRTVSRKLKTGIEFLCKILSKNEKKDID